MYHDSGNNFVIGLCQSFVCARSEQYFFHNEKSYSHRTPLLTTYFRAFESPRIKYAESIYWQNSSMFAHSGCSRTLKGNDPYDLITRCALMWQCFYQGEVRWCLFFSFHKNILFVCWRCKKPIMEFMVAQRNFQGNWIIQGGLLCQLFSILASLEFQVALSMPSFYLRVSHRNTAHWPWFNSQLGSNACEAKCRNGIGYMCAKLDPSFFPAHVQWLDQEGASSQTIILERMDFSLAKMRYSHTRGK